MWTHWGPNRFFLPNPICLNFQQQNPLKNQYLPHLSSEIYEMNFIKSDLLRAFQQYHEHPQIPIEFSFFILFNFHWKNGSITNSFHTIAPNSLKPSWCTLTHQELSKDMKSAAWNTLVGRSRQTKQNKLPLFIDRLV
jgi:hypothetical protein